METEADRQRIFTRRALVVGGGQAVIFTTLVARMVYLSVFQNDHFKLLAEDNRISLRPILPRRGLILDRNGYPLALNRPDFRLTLIPEQAGDIESALNAIARYQPLTFEDRAKIMESISRVPKFMPVEVARDMDWTAFSAINVQSNSIPGIQPIQGYTRYYPDGPAVAHVIGYVGAPTEKMLDQENDPMLTLPGFKVGKDGIEKVYDKELRGQAGADRVEVNALGRTIRKLEQKLDTPGMPIQLTLDRELQVYTAFRLQSESASAIVMDCNTGDILALSSVPAFDPNNFSSGIKSVEWQKLLSDEYHPLINKPVQGLYPPGSTFKMIVALAGLKAGIVPEAGVSCSGRYRLGNFFFHCWKRRGHGFVNMHGGIVQSCDVFFYDLGRTLGIQAIADMARMFGLGQTFDLPIPTQKKGIIPDPTWKAKRYKQPWLAGETLNAAIGQGYTVTTPLQLAVMAARLASGRAVVPRLVKSEESKPAPLLDIDPEHLAVIRQAMSDVVNSSQGTAQGARIKLDGIQMAGKTGTAQVRRISMAERKSGVRKDESLPWRQRDHALFVAFAPVESPRYACAVVVEHGSHGATSAAPVARDILSFLFAREKKIAIDPVPSKKDELQIPEEDIPSAPEPPEVIAPMVATAPSTPEE